MEKMKYPPGYEEEFWGTASIYARRRMDAYEEHLKNGTSDDEYLKVRFAIRDEMFEKLHQIRAKYGVLDPSSENER